MRRSRRAVFPAWKGYRFMKAKHPQARNAGREGPRLVDEPLRDDEERLRLAIAATHDKIWDLDVSTGTVRWNENYARAFHRPLDTGGSLQWWIDRIHPDDRERTTSTLSAAVAGSQIDWECEYRFLRPDGTWAHLHDRAYISRDALGNARRVIGAMQDLTERKAAEQALRRSEELQRHIFEALPAHIAVVNRQGTILAANRAWTEFAAANQAANHPSVSLGANYLEVCRRAVHEGDSGAAEALAGIEAVLSGQLPRFACEYPCDAPHEARWFSMTVVPLQQECAAGGAVISHFDITGRRLAEEALRRSEERFRELVELSLDGIFVADSQGHYLDVNPAGARMLGYSAAEICQLSIADVIAPDEIPRIPIEIAKFAGGASVLSEWQFLRKDQSSFFGEVLGRQFPDGRLQGIVRDVTQRKQAEIALRESEERLRTAAKAAQFGTFDEDLVAGTVYWSPEMAAILGPDTVPGTFARKGAPGFVHPDDAPGLAAMMRSALAPSRRGPIEHEHRIRRPDGTIRWVLLKGMVQFAPRGRRSTPVRLSGVLLDITARKETELQLAESLRHLRQAQDELMRRERLATLGQLAGSVAHEVRTPLSVILNGIVFLEMSLPSRDPTLQEVLGEMRRAIGSSDEIITEMLDFVREPLLQPTEFPLSEAITQAIRLVPIPETVRLHLPSSTSAALRVLANLDQIVRILVNLIQNAVQAMPHGGDLDLAAHHESSGRVCFTVRDTGCGIPPQNLGRVFEPLFSTKVRGIGLGLSIAQRYARLNGGELSVKSRVDHGTSFYLSLPAAKTAPSASP